MLRLRNFLPAVVLMALAACSSIDCPLNSRVMATYKFGGNSQTLTDSLTVSTTKTDGEDSVLVNRVIGVDSISLPMSYNHTSDIYYFEFAATDLSRTIDTVTVTKQDHPHFESVDCNPMIFHTVTAVEHTSHKIDSIKITNNYVTYNTENAHFIIYLKDNAE